MAIFQRIVVKADLSTLYLKNPYLRVPKWKSENPKEGSKALTDAIAADLSQ
jgi:hypothetical protein